MRTAGGARAGLDPASPHACVSIAGSTSTLSKVAGTPFVSSRRRSSRRSRQTQAAPCTGNAAALFTCAQASLYAGNDADAERLEFEAAAQTIEGQRAVLPRALDPSCCSPALTCPDSSDSRPRSTSTTCRRGPIGTTNPPQFSTLSSPSVTTTPSRTWRRGGCGQGTYAEPFALRALGVARGDAKLLDEASSRFRAIGLRLARRRDGGLARQDDRRVATAATETRRDPRPSNEILRGFDSPPPHSHAQGPIRMG